MCGGGGGLHHVGIFCHMCVVPLNCLLVPTSLVEVVEGTGYLGRVEPGMLLWQSAMTLHVKHQITSIDTLYHKEQPGEREGGEGGRERGREGEREGESREGEQKEGEFMFTVGHIFY